MKASEARTQWKQLLDRAVAGEVIKIERAGVTFYLGTTESIAAGQGRIVDTAISLGQHIEKERAKDDEIIGMHEDPIENIRLPKIVSPKTTPKEIANDKSFEFCKHDQVKGFCKYGCK